MRSVACIVKIRIENHDATSELDAIADGYGQIARDPHTRSDDDVRSDSQNTRDGEVRAHRLGAKQQIVADRDPCVLRTTDIWDAAHPRASTERAHAHAKVHASDHGLSTVMSRGAWIKSMSSQM